MEIVNFLDHEFDKVNLVTQKDKKGSYDKYKCAHCGLTGKRRTLGNEIEVISSKPCTRPKPKLVEIIDDRNLIQFGFIRGDILSIVECPEKYRNKYNNSVWVFSKERKEPVRLLTSEYKSL